MTREEVIRLAREAKLSNEIGAFGYPYLPELERFAALIAEKEREACVKLVYGYCESDNAAQRIVDAIRARGKNE